MRISEAGMFANSINSCVSKMASRSCAGWPADPDCQSVVSLGTTDPDCQGLPNVHHSEPLPNDVAHNPLQRTTRRNQQRQLHLTIVVFLALHKRTTMYCPRGPWFLLVGVVENPTRELRLSLHTGLMASMEGPIGRRLLRYRTVVERRKTTSS